MKKQVRSRTAALQHRNPPEAGPSVFINYRRTDCESAAQHLADDLERHLGESAVFLDQKRIAVGSKWPKVLQNKLEGSKVVLACIGERWPEILNDQTKDNRLNDKNDWVRRELEIARQKKIPVIPVLLEGRTTMPTAALRLRKSLAFVADIEPLILRKGSEREHSIQKLLKRLAELGIKPLPAESVTTPLREQAVDTTAPGYQRGSTVLNQGVLARVRATKTLRVGFFRYPPLIDYTDTNGTISTHGLYADVLKSFARKEGIRIEWSPLNLAGAIHAVSSHEVDCYACIMLSDVRYRECDFVGLFHSIAVVGIVLSDEESIRHPSDLTDRQEIRIAVCDGEIGHHTATTTLRIPQRRLIAVNSDDIASISAHVLDGSAVVALADALSCKRMLKRTRDRSQFKLIFADPPFLTVPNGFMIAKDNADFRDWLNNGLQQAFRTGAFADVEKTISDEFGNSIIRW